MHVENNVCKYFYFVIHISMFTFAFGDYFPVDTCVPGDMVTVAGVVKVTNSDEG